MRQEDHLDGPEKSNAGVFGAFLEAAVALFGRDVVLQHLHSRAVFDLDDIDEIGRIYGVDGAGHLAEVFTLAALRLSAYVDGLGGCNMSVGQAYDPAETYRLVIGMRAVEGSGGGRALALEAAAAHLPPGKFASELEIVLSLEGVDLLHDVVEVLPIALLIASRL